MAIKKQHEKVSKATSHRSASKTRNVSNIFRTVVASPKNKIFGQQIILNNVPWSTSLPYHFSQQPSYLAIPFSRFLLHAINTLGSMFIYTLFEKRSLVGTEPSSKTMSQSLTKLRLAQFFSALRTLRSAPIAFEVVK